MKKSLKVLLLSGVTLLMVACMDPAEDQIAVSSSSEPTEEVVSESEVEESIQENLSESESSIDDAESDASNSDISEEDSKVSESNEESIEGESINSGEVDSSESESSSEVESTETDSDEATEAVDEIEPVVVDMINQDGDSMGTATFEEAANGVILTLELEDLEEGEYGFHIHEYGKATPPTFMDALGHFNPTEANHGIHAEGGPHIGDFPNLIVGKDGKVNIVLVVSNVSLDPEAPYTLRTENGTSLIIHEGPDDYETQPIGTAGYGMIGGVIFAPIKEVPTETDDETSEGLSQENSNEMASSLDSESSEETPNEESSKTSSEDEGTESESKSEE